jgi:RND family efflux transporter MFP subunit
MDFMKFQALPPLHLSRPVRKTLLAVGLFCAGAAVCYGALALTGTTPGRLHSDPSAGSHTESSPEESFEVHLAKSKWAVAGIQIKPAGKAPMSEQAWRTGKVALDQSRLAHLYPLVEGVVREVPVRLGQEVRARDVLAVVDSKEVGQEKLDLVKNRLGLSLAQAQEKWALTVSGNVEELLGAIAKNEAADQIDQRMKGRPIGEWRQQLLSAYVRRDQLKMLFHDATGLFQRGALSLAGFRKNQADYESAQAALTGLWEQVKFQNRQHTRAAQQKLREAETAVTLNLTRLMMMGFTREEAQAMDPVAEGQKVSLYPLRAPFAGTVIAKRATLSERVGPQSLVFQIADLSTVWIEADIPEADVSLLQTLDGNKLRFRAAGREAEATVFYRGDLVDKSSRAITLRATAPNPGRWLKPGMFIEVQLTARPGAPVVQVPATAVQHHDNRSFVFVHEGDDLFRRIDVTVGRAAGTLVEIKAGLSGGEPVVVQGGFALKTEMLRALLSGE